MWDIACGTKVYIHNQYTDDGGGGTQNNMYKKLKEVGRMYNEVDCYYVVTCSIHGLDMVLCVPVESYLGIGGIESQNIIQLMCVAYNLSQNC